MATKSKADAMEAIRRSGEARKLTKSEEQRRFYSKRNAITQAVVGDYCHD